MIQEVLDDLKKEILEQTDEIGKELKEGKMNREEIEVEKELIEKIKFNGMVDALRNRTGNLIFEFCSCFNDIKTQNKYIRLGEAIQDAEIILEKMKLSLKALQEITDDK